MTLPKIYLLHGAGAGHSSDFLSELKLQLTKHTKLEVHPITLKYMQQIEETSSRRPPPKFDKLVAEVQETIPVNGPVILIGKSMGARLATQLTASHNVKGVVCFGFPFHPLGKKEKHRLSYLDNMQAPCLIYQGTKDAMGNQEWVASQSLPSNVSVQWIDGANHDFKRAKKYNTTQSELINELASSTNEWIKLNSF